MSSGEFPWDRIMHVGLGLLRLPPEAFWRSTLRELSAALAIPGEGFGRERLEQLMKEFPDHDG